MRQAAAVLGGGCFWCLEAVFQRLQGVSAVTSGYAGGQPDRPTYQQVCTGTTNHAEVVRVQFDPAVLPFDKLLEVFLLLHDPTTPNRQGADVGTQYRSVIFCQDDEQARIARGVIEAVEASGVYSAPVVTQVVPPPAPTFWPAEDHHQDYYNTHGFQPYCQVVIDPKLRKLLKLFPNQVAEKSI
jgi:peptide-methionine (S)-S-oxide reductase